MWKGNVLVVAVVRLAGWRTVGGSRREEADFSLLRVSQGGRGIFSWLGVSATGRYVRLEALEAEGMVEERILSLLEVCPVNSVSLL